MPEYLAPGVYVEEISTGPKPIEGVSTSVAGFVGPTERGPEDIRFITSWLAYQRWYGDHLGPDFSYMSYAVQGFFDNGGQRCFIGRIARSNAIPAAQRELGGLTATALGRGDWGNRIILRVMPSSNTVSQVKKAVDEKWVRVQVAYFSTPLPDGDIIDFTKPENVTHPQRRSPDLFEDYDNLSPEPKASNYLVNAVNLDSKLIRLNVNAGATLSDLPSGPEFKRFSGGTNGDGAITLEDYVGSDKPLNGNADLFGQGSGLTAMDSVDEVSLLLAPDHTKFGENLLSEVVKRCERLRDRFAVLSTDLSFPQTGKPTLDTTFGAQYHPWIKIYDSYTRSDVMVPPAGHVAGIIARTDLEQGVHKAPANAIVIGAKGLQKPITKGDQALLNPVGINCIRDFRSDGRGIRLWGARTMTSDPEWKYVNVRRLFLFVEESIDEGTQWVVFEPNAPSTWARVQQSITSFLITIWRNGALFGNTQDEAFFVKCDRTTMTQDDIDNGRLICYIGIAPVKPAEFVIFRIGQKTAGAAA
jgi:phage tail sheath protein FI